MADICKNNNCIQRFKEIESELADLYERFGIFHYIHVDESLIKKWFDKMNDYNSIFGLYISELYTQDYNKLYIKNEREGSFYAWDGQKFVTHSRDDIFTNIIIPFNTELKSYCENRLLDVLYDIPNKNEKLDNIIDVREEEKEKAKDKIRPLIERCKKIEDGIPLVCNSLFKIFIVSINENNGRKRLVKRAKKATTTAAE